MKYFFEIFLITQPCGFVCQSLRGFGNEGVWLSVVHEHRFRPTREVKAETFNPRTTFCRPGISNSPLIFFLRDWQYYYSSTAMPEGKPQPGILKIKYAF